MDQLSDEKYEYAWLEENRIIEREEKMSLFDALKGIAKDVSKDVMKEVVKGVTGESLSSAATGNSNVEKSSDQNAPVQQLQTVAFQKRDLSDSHWEKFICFETDEAGNDVEYQQKFKIPDGFVPFDSGAGEIDVSYLYAPEDASEGETEYDSSKPALMISFEQKHHELLNKYLQEKVIPTGDEVVRLENSIADYKTTTHAGPLLSVAYHYHRKYDKNLYYHIVLQMPQNLEDTESGKLARQGLELMVSTLSFE